MKDELFADLLASAEEMIRLQGNPLIINLLKVI